MSLDAKPALVSRSELEALEELTNKWNKRYNPYDNVIKFPIERPIPLKEAQENYNEQESIKGKRNQIYNDILSVKGMYPRFANAKMQQDAKSFFRSLWQVHSGGKDEGSNQ